MVWRLGGAFIAVASALAVTPGVLPARQSTRPPARPPESLAPLDPQRVQDQQDMTWADYRPIPGVNWADAARVPEPPRTLRVALVAVDFADQPFVITLPKHSDPFGNPQIDPIPREEVARFYADFLGKPGLLNHGHTINGYWMEQSRGKVGIPAIDPYGPYRLPKNLFQYGLNEFGQRDACPTGYTCDGRIEPDADRLWIADAGPEIKSRYDIVLRIYAGYDETSVWQEFGEMKFASKEDIPAEWGNPDATKPRWVVTRYVPWTSWKAGAQQWGLSSVRQGESSGTITHEIAHFAFKTGDNNNNPYVLPYRRVGSGPWDIMDRGSFNGPGGPHRRWVVPATEGAAMPAGFMLRNRIRYAFVRPETVLTLNRNGLASSGLAVATIAARAVEPEPGRLAGLTVALDGDAPRDRTPPCDMKADPLCAGAPVFNFYSVEVVQRIGYDSFTPDNGVLIAKNKDREGLSCGYNCFTWVIDAHPEDIDTLDFVRPDPSTLRQAQGRPERGRGARGSGSPRASSRGDGSRVMRTIADYRQLNDALFHAGLDSGSAFEWQDAANRLHFYVVDVHKDASGILSYTVGVRSLDGAGPQTRGVAASAPAAHALDGASASFDVTVRNTGAAAPIGAALHPQDASAFLAGDIYRLSVSVDGRGWAAALRNALVAARFGESVRVPVSVTRSASGAASTGRVALTAVSESDPSKKATVTTIVRR
jgi:M6 family metalloprotease-like protein